MNSRLNVSDIVIGKRYRKDPGDLSELKESIEKRGLINPITIRRGENLLLAGVRRFECLKQLGVTERSVLSGNDSKVVRFRGSRYALSMVKRHLQNSSFG